MQLVQVAAYSTRFEAQVVVSRLASAGIPAFTSADDLGGTLPLMHLAEGGCRVFVPTPHEATARREITRVGSHAVDTIALDSPVQPAADERVRRRGYVIAVVIGWFLGYTPWHFFGG